MKMTEKEHNCGDINKSYLLATINSCHHKEDLWDLVLCDVDPKPERRLGHSEKNAEKNQAKTRKSITADLDRLGTSIFDTRDRHSSVVFYA
jgi:hypothetical protein